MARRRVAAIAIAIGLHLLILAMFLSSRPRTYSVARTEGGAMDISLAGFSRGSAPSKTSAAPATPTLTPPIQADPIKPRSVLAIVSDILAVPLPEHSAMPTPLVATPSPVMTRAMAQASGAPGAACDISGAIQSALRADPVVHDTLITIPTKGRTAADAVLLWNGEWIASVEAAEAPALAALRTAVQQVISAGRLDCREQEIVGPRFMLVPDGDATMVVVFGNAAWRWSDLLSSADAPAAVRSRTNPAD